MDAARLRKKIAHVGQGQDFNALALEIFRYQASANPVYRSFIELLGINPGRVATLAEIPFLPVSFFKSHRLECDKPEALTVFTSSGTTGLSTSRHYVKDPAFYLDNALRSFRLFYGPPSDYTILALLPGYLERQGSSLIYMVEHFIQESASPQSGFYLHDYEALCRQLEDLEQKGKKTLLLGVSHALLDLAEYRSFSLKHTLVMETGGMKGKRKEMTREALHDTLCHAFGVNAIHSEYGMTELLSQAYSKGEGLFQSPPWLKVRIRQADDPWTYMAPGKSGAVNLIDLANIDSLSFLATDDLGRVHADGSFEIIGRLDHSDIRGCNMLVQ